MTPENRSQLLLGWTRARAKMYEYVVPREDFARMYRNPRDLFSLSIGMLGDLASGINRGELDADKIAALRDELLFSARFFDAYVNSKLDKELDSYFLLLCSASYYLARLPGSSMVLAKEIGSECPDISGEGLEVFLLWLLHADLSYHFANSSGDFGGYIDAISALFLNYYKTGEGEEHIIRTANDLRAIAYEFGTPRQLLLGDVACAVIRTRIENSCWNTLPRYSGLASEQWADVLNKESFLKELWPAQILLGEAGIFAGRSAVVQMPTSAGKTKATELIIRSAFLAGRVSLAVIIAPFRALCHEIRDGLASAFQDDSIKVDELADTMQIDFDISLLLGRPQILVVTPEKFLYVIRQNPELAKDVGLVIFDEGHQFDSGNRGIVYELLLTSLRSMLSSETQKVLISAVINNAVSVANWLNSDSTVVRGANLSPTLKSIGFASWEDTVGQIKYVKTDRTREDDFFVPRVIESIKLGMKPKERKVRVFPDRSSSDAGKEIALFLGLKLVNEGAVAVFCGRKDTASNICAMVAERFSRGLEMPAPITYSDIAEVTRLTSLIEANLGGNSSAASSARLGIFPHHGNTPHGIRLAVESAMRGEQIKFVVCTSTLAQGVNLPIRYLIVTSIYQGKDEIKVRDFHNLIGRVGRAGMHTEGSVLFSDPDVYDFRKDRWEGWRWKKVQALLDPSNSEDCVSSLLELLPLEIYNDRSASRDQKEHSFQWDILIFAQYYLMGEDALTALAAQIAQDRSATGFTEKIVRKQFGFLGRTLSAIESFLLANWDSGLDELHVEDAIILVEETLAFFLSDEEQRKSLKELFSILASNLIKSVESPGRRQAYGRTLFGVGEAREIEQWVIVNRGRLLEAEGIDELLDVLWEVLSTHMKNEILGKYDPPSVLKSVAEMRLAGGSFKEILELVEKLNGKMIWGNQRRPFNIDQMVETCENGFSFDGSLVISAIIEFLLLADSDGTENLRGDLQRFQKQLKYGLPNQASVALYEMGFADRVVAMSIADDFLLQNENRNSVEEILRSQGEWATTSVERFPTYFQDRMAQFFE